MRINAYGVAKYTNKIRINHDKTTIFRHWADDQSQSSRRSAGIDRRIFRYQADNSTVSCWWNFCFLLVELLFSAGETLVSDWRNTRILQRIQSLITENISPKSETIYRQDEHTETRLSHDSESWNSLTFTNPILLRNNFYFFSLPKNMMLLSSSSMVSSKDWSFFRSSSVQSLSFMRSWIYSMR